MKLGGGMCHGPEKNPLSFGVDPNPEADIGIYFNNLSKPYAGDLRI